MDVLASLLSSGEYELQLKGLCQREGPKDIGYFYFSAEKPNSSLLHAHLRQGSLICLNGWRSHGVKALENGSEPLTSENAATQILGYYPGAR